MLFHIDCYIKVYQSFSITCNLTGKDSQYTEIILPIMLALCLMLSSTYYAQNYASIIGWCLELSQGSLHGQMKITHK